MKFFYEFIQTYKESFKEKSRNSAQSLINDITFLNKKDNFFDLPQEMIIENLYESEY